jgi:hypothetical protein
MQNLCLGTECTISGYRSSEASILLHWSKIDVWDCFGAFQLPSTGKRCKTCVRATMHYFGVSKSLNISIRPKVMFGSVSEYFTNLRQVKRYKTCVSGLNGLFRSTEVVKHPFYSIGPKLMFGSVSEHFSNLQGKRCKTYVWERNALFRGTEVVKHPFYSSGPIMMFGSVSEHFTNL